MSNIYRLPPRPIDTHDLQPEPDRFWQYAECVFWGAALALLLTWLDVDGAIIDAWIGSLR